MLSVKKSYGPKINHLYSGYELIAPITEAREDLLADERKMLELYSRLPARAGDNFFTKKHLRPQDFHKLLPRTMMIALEFNDCSHLQDAVVRLNGEKVIHIYGELRHKSIRLIEDEVAVKRAFAAIEAVLSHKQPVVGQSIRVRTDLPYRQFRNLFLPIFTNEGAITEVLMLLTVGKPEK